MQIIRIRYPLSVKISRLAFGIHKVAVDPRLVDSVKLALISKQICLPQGPRLCHGQPVQLVSDFKKAIILVLEAFIYFALAALQLVYTVPVDRSARNLPFENNISPPPTPFHQRFRIFLPSQNIAIGINEVTIFLSVLDLLQLFPKVVDFCLRELGCAALISDAAKESSFRINTLERVLTAEVDLKIETSVSCVCTNSGASTASPFCSFSNESWHCSRRLSRSVSRAGE